MGSFGGSKPAPQQQQQTQVNEPWSQQIPYLTYGFQQAQDRYKQAGPEYFPGDTYVPFSDYSTQALDMIGNRAQEGSQFGGAADQYLSDVLGGEYLGSNPYIDQVADKVAGKARAGTDSYFNSIGRFGSPAAGRATGEAISDSVANLYMNDYQNERNMQQGALGYAPSIANLDYMDANQLLGAGGLQEGKSYEALQDDVNRFNYEQNIPDQKLAQYMGLIGGNYGGTTTGSSVVNPSYSKGSGIGSALGFGLQAAPIIGGSF